MPPVEQGSRGISDFLEKMLASPWKETVLEYFCDYFCWGTNFGISIFLLLVHMFQQSETCEHLDNFSGWPRFWHRLAD